MEIPKKKSIEPPRKERSYAFEQLKTLQVKELYREMKFCQKRISKYYRQYKNNQHILDHIGSTGMTNERQRTIRAKYICLGKVQEAKRQEHWIEGQIKRLEG